MTVMLSEISTTSSTKPQAVRGRRVGQTVGGEEDGGFKNKCASKCGLMSTHGSCLS